MKLSDLYLGARDLVGQGWCRGALAEDAQGLHVEPEDARARAWCALGAIDRVARLNGSRMSPWAQEFIEEHFEDELAPLAPLAGAACLIEWNDDKAESWHDVYDLFDRAAALAKEKESCR